MFTPTQTMPELLRAQVQGAVIVPGDAGYDQARAAWNLTVDQRPAVIVVAERAADVVAAVRFARAEELGIAVQSTGHGIAVPANDAVLIITSNMHAVRINAAAQTAWIEAGALWGDVLQETQAVGLAPLLGSSPNVGVVGYTLGGGMGWLARKYGLATDSVHAFDVVTADGELRRVSASEHSDLFWGLRGGGGSFGVVLGMEIQLYPVTTVYGGNLIYPAALAKDVIARFREWITTAPDELTSSFAIMNFPPIPQIPEFLRGQSVIMVRGCYSGPVEQGEALIQPWLDWQAPIANTWAAMPFSDVATISDDPQDPSAGFASGAWLRDLSADAVDTLLRYAISVNGSSPVVMTEVRHAGGAIARVPEQANAYSHRQETLLLELVSMTPTPEAFLAARQYVATFKEALQPHLSGGVYMNFLEGSEAGERTRQGYSAESHRRLMTLKAAYDPDNLFRYSYDIPPVADAG